MSFPRGGVGNLEHPPTADTNETPFPTGVPTMTTTKPIVQPYNDVPTLEMKSKAAVSVSTREEPTLLHVDDAS